MDLPGELRNRIYEIALYHAQDDGTISPDTASLGDVEHTCNRACLVQPALTHISRQVREESLPFFYGENKFDLYTRSPSKTTQAAGEDVGFVHFDLTDEFPTVDVREAPAAWWRGIGDSNLRLVKHLCIDHGNGPFLRQVGVKLEIDRRGDSTRVQLLEGGEESVSGYSIDVCRDTPKTAEYVPQLL